MAHFSGTKQSQKIKSHRKSKARAKQEQHTKHTSITQSRQERNRRKPASVLSGHRDTRKLYIVTSRSSLVFLVVAITLAWRFFKCRTSSNPRPRFPPITSTFPRNGCASSVEEAMILLSKGARGCRWCGRCYFARIINIG